MITIDIGKLSRYALHVSNRNDTGKRTSQR